MSGGRLAVLAMELELIGKELKRLAKEWAEIEAQQAEMAQVSAAITTAVNSDAEG